MSMRVAISGAGGRMGRALLEAIAHADDLTLASSFDIGGDVRAALSAADVLIDFTRPEGTSSTWAPASMRNARW
jgi:4-hydroxy-tetrahydrodipicolinate reductase